MIVDQAGFTVALVNNHPAQLTITGDHNLTRPADWAVFVPLGAGCAGAASFSKAHGGPVTAAPYTVSVSLVATTPTYALCLAHQ
eukprot:990099-Prymnesium_polylepis.1